jgi:hypothetical protein
MAQSKKKIILNRKGQKKKSDLNQTNEKKNSYLLTLQECQAA